MLKPPTKALLRHDVLLVAGLARISGTEQEQFCDYVCDTVEMVWKLDRRAVTSKSGDALVKAASAARTLNEAVCSLNGRDRQWVNMIADRHPSLSQEQRIRGTTDLFEINELNYTVWLLATLFNFATNKSSPMVAGVVRVPDKKGKKSGIGNDMMFEFVLRRLLTATAEARGRLSFNKNSCTGALVEALALLRDRLPQGVIPKALTGWTIQEIKTSHAKSRRRWLQSPK
jgi:hypothetical protein